MLIFSGVLGSCLSIWPKAKNASRFGGWLARCWLFGGVLCLATFWNLESAKSFDNSVMNLKLYAYNKFKTWDQFSCYNYLIFKESSWNYKARNNSHFGLGQMKNKMVLKLTPRQQIDLHLKYVGHRYGYVNNEPNACLAAEHFDKKGWH
jgi:hypothetical protein